MPRPIKELKGFAKVGLKAGESRVAAIELPPRSFAFFDLAAAGWRIEAGTYDISAGFSSADLPLTGQVQVAGQVLPL